MVPARRLPVLVGRGRDVDARRSRSASDPTGRIRNWDQRVNVARRRTALVSFTWTYDSETVTYQDIQRRISADEGLTWTEAEPSGSPTRPGIPAILSDGRVVLAWVDHFETLSLRARLAASIDARVRPCDRGRACTRCRRRLRRRGHGDGGEALVAMQTWTFGSPFALPLAGRDGARVGLRRRGHRRDVGINWYVLDPDA